MQQPNPVAHEPSNNLSLKAIGTLQKENSVLMRRVRELEQRPKYEEASKTDDTKSHLDEIRHFGRIYAYMVNMFITAKECKPSKEARNYDPEQRFGTHRKEGNFCELLEHLPREFMDDLDGHQHDLFTKHVESSCRCCETMKLTSLLLFLISICGVLALVTRQTHQPMVP